MGWGGEEDGRASKVRMLFAMSLMMAMRRLAVMMMIPHISEYGNERDADATDAVEQIYLLTLNNNATYTNTCCVCSIEKSHPRCSRSVSDSIHLSVQF